VLAVLWFRRRVAETSPQKPDFKARPVDAEFVVNKLTLRQPLPLSA